MALTALQVRQAAGRERAYKVSDGGGLYLFIQPSGQKYWRLAYRWAALQRTMAPGVFPAITLVYARRRRDEVPRLIAHGIDPPASAREKKAKVRLAAQSTFRAVANEFLEKCEREGRAPVTLSKLRWLIDIASRKLAARAISEITAAEVYDALRGIEAKGHYETARWLRSVCSQVFRFAVATGRAERDVWADLRGAIATPWVNECRKLGSSTKLLNACNWVDLIYG